METFVERAEKDGLSIVSERTFLYEDTYGAVRYEGVKTQSDVSLPYFAVFASKDSQKFGRLGGFVSDTYQFIGNESVVSKVKESIEGTGKPILSERTFLNAPRFTRFWHEIEVKNIVSTPTDGDIIPQLTVQNSYDGTGVARVSFGISLMGNYRITFRTKMGSYQQIHTSKSKTVLTGVFGSFFEIFNENINDLISSNSSKQLSEEDIMKALDLVEESGKKKREEISVYLAEMTKNNPVTNWNLFLAIAKFSSKEGNLNTKVLLENIAERVLIVPEKMIKALRGQ